jgi:hypothetical protein
MYAVGTNCCPVSDNLANNTPVDVILEEKARA